MAHFLHDARLQAYEITGKNEVYDLALAVFGGFVAQAEAAQDGKKLWAVRSLHKNGRPGVDGQFADLETLHELDLFGGEIDVGILVAQWASLTLDRHATVFTLYVTV